MWAARKRNAEADLYSETVKEGSKVARRQRIEKMRRKVITSHPNSYFHYPQLTSVIGRGAIPLRFDVNLVPQQFAATMTVFNHPVLLVFRFSPPSKTISQFTTQNPSSSTKNHPHKSISTPIAYLSLAKHLASFATDRQPHYHHPPIQPSPNKLKCHHQKSPRPPLARNSSTSSQTYAQKAKEPTIDDNTTLPS